MNKIFVDIKKKYIYFRNFCFYAADQNQDSLNFISTLPMDSVMIEWQHNTIASHA